MRELCLPGICDDPKGAVGSCIQEACEQTLHDCLLVTVCCVVQSVVES